MKDEDEWTCSGDVVAKKAADSNLNNFEDVVLGEIPSPFAMDS